MELSYDVFEELSMHKYFNGNDLEIIKAQYMKVKLFKAFCKAQKIGKPTINEARQFNDLENYFEYEIELKLTKKEKNRQS